MKIELRKNLIYTSISVCHNGLIIQIDDALIDTGSASTVVSIDILSEIGIKPESSDLIRTIRGVGGVEAVFSRKMDYLQVGEYRIKPFEIEIAGMDYGFGINAILGMDFLISAGVVLNLKKCEMEFK